MVDITSVFIDSVQRAVGDSVGQNKPLIVYITSEEAQDEWIKNLLNEDLLRLIKEKSVALKLIKGSDECIMFEQIFPNVIVPSVFCIRVSSILDVIHGSITEEEFSTRVHKVLNSPVPEGPVPVSQPQGGSASHSATQEPTQQATQQHSSQPQYQTPSAASPFPSSSYTLNSSDSTPNPSQSYASRPSSASPAPSSSSKRDYKSLKEQAAELSAKRYKEEQIRKAQQAKEEKERIRRLLKADEEERRIIREQTQKDRERRLSNEQEELDDEHRIDEIIHEHEESLKENIHRRLPSSSGDVCALSIRLLNGRSLTHVFKVTDTLSDVRTWIDQNRTDGEDPYCFHRTIPRVTFGVVDEEKTLGSLDLVPRSALVLKPFASYTSAYGGKGVNSNRVGFFSRILDGFSSLWPGAANDEIDSSSSSHTGPASSNYHREGPFHGPVSSTQSSQYGSPAQSPVFGNSGLLNLAHPSALNLNIHNDPTETHTPIQLPSAQISRSGSPTIPSLARMDSNIRTLSDTAINDDRTTYNGNTINLEDDKKSKS